MADDNVLRQRLSEVLPHLNEQQRRILLAAEARSLGRGGVSRVARASGISRATIQRALQGEPEQLLEEGRLRRAGAGRKKARELDPGLVPALEALIEPLTRGDPMSPLRWTCKSTRQLAAALQAQGHQVSDHVVRNLLHEAGYSLQANAKTLEGTQHPDRDAQFSYLNRQVQRFLKAGQPVLSVDCKKKELVGRFKNGGQEWHPSGEPEPVNVHDFPVKALGKAIPYGIYDVGRNTGWVSVGRDHDTASFAASSIKRWWEIAGSAVYPKARRLLICADGGGSNGYRSRLWKLELQGLANATGLNITVCHLPPGTSKWNKIEHRLFSHITMNWRGRPSVSHEVIVELIAATTSRKGLKVQAEADPQPYPTGIAVSDQQLAAVKLYPHSFHGEWNYTVRASRDTS